MCESYGGAIPAASATADPMLRTLQRIEVADEAGARVLWSAPFHPVTLGKSSDVISADWPGAAGSHGAAGL